MENQPHHREGGAPSQPQPQPQPQLQLQSQPQQPPPSETPAPRRRASGVKRKANNSNSSAPKRYRGSKKFTPLPHINHDGPITRARQSPNKIAAAAAYTTTSFPSTSTTSPSFLDKPAEPLLQPTPPIGEITTTSQQLVPANEDQIAPLEPDIDAEFEAIRSRDPNAHVVPTPAAWFSWTKIHPIEERALASFFNGKSETRTPDVYMEIRNSIMKKFHLDPNKQIEVKDLSEMTVGELDARQAVMEFLDHWGLINFHPFPIKDDDKAEIKTVASTKTDMLVDKLYRFEVGLSGPQVGVRADLSTQAVPPRLIPESAIADEVRPEGPAVEYHCNSCAADCSRKRYHCQKQADFDLCSECYNNGKFDSGMSPADFILMEPAELPGVSGGSWTDQETLLLLEALELFGENWTEIAEHVATKTKAQCILHFVQMPIEDIFLEGKDDSGDSFQGSTGPGTTSNDSFALKEPTDQKKEPTEVLESKSADNTELSAVKESHETKESNTKNIGSSILSNLTETTESKSVFEEKHLSVDVSDPIGTVEANISQEISVNCAINALKEAFEAVGSGESVSFSDASNPVMALAAFLSGLVEHKIAAASARSSLKSTLEEAPGIQLASRHCFILENLPGDLKDPPAPESVDMEMLDGEAKKDDVNALKDEPLKEEDHVQKDVSMESQKDKDQNGDDSQVPYRNCSTDTEMPDGEAKKDEDKALKDECLKEENHVQNDVSMESQKDKDQKGDDFQVQNLMSVLDGSDASRDCKDMEIEDAVSKETVIFGCLPYEGKQNCTTKDPGNVINKEHVVSGSSEVADDVTNEATGSASELHDSALPKQDPGQDQCSPKDVDNEGCTAKESDNVTSNKDDVQPSTMKDSDDLVLQGRDLPSTVDVSVDIRIETEVAPIPVKESTSVTPLGEISQHLEVPNDVAVEFSSVPSEDNDSQKTVAPSLVFESDDSPVPRKDLLCTVNGSVDTSIQSEVASISVKESAQESTEGAPLGEISQPLEVPKDADMDSCSVHSEEKDPQEAVVPSSAVETQANAGECGSNGDKICKLSDARDDHSVDTLKRAALTALSAAAVKSKLLADQEEDQIRQLAAVLIEKQLHKIETKLGFFTDMENAIMKAREQMDRSRKSLYQERNKIISDRLSTASASRVMPTSSPSSRLAMSFANSMPKSLLNLNSQKTPAKTITKTSGPSPSLSSVSNAAPGGSVHTREGKLGPAGKSK